MLILCYSVDTVEYVLEYSGVFYCLPCYAYGKSCIQSIMHADL